MCLSWANDVSYPALPQPKTTLDWFSISHKIKTSYHFNVVAVWFIADLMKGEVNGGFAYWPSNKKTRSKCRWHRHHLLPFSVSSLTSVQTFFPTPSAVMAQMDKCLKCHYILDKMQLTSWHSLFILCLIISHVLWLLSQRLISESVPIIRVNLWMVRWGESGATMVCVHRVQKRFLSCSLVSDGSCRQAK